MEDMMEYKGYYARIKYSAKDGCFIGVVEGLNQAHITFEGKSIKELKRDFKNAIDEHLKMCKDLKLDPERQCKGSLNVRLGPELHLKAKIKAIEEHITINELIKRAVTMYVSM